MDPSAHDKRARFLYNGHRQAFAFFGGRRAENRLVTIGSGAFRMCQSLTLVRIPQSVTSVGYWAFTDCTGLDCVIFMNPDCVIGDGDYDVFDGCGDVILYGCYRSTRTSARTIPG